MTCALVSCLASLREQVELGHLSFYCVGREIFAAGTEFVDAAQQCFDTPRLRGDIGHTDPPARPARLGMLTRHPSHLLPAPWVPTRSGLLETPASCRTVGFELTRLPGYVPLIVSATNWTLVQKSVRDGASQLLGGLVLGHMVQVDHGIELEPALLFGSQLPAHLAGDTGHQ